MCIRVGKAIEDTHFDNVLSCEKRKLCVVKTNGAVLLNGVTVTDSLLVKEYCRANIYLLKPENTLGNVRVEKTAL